MNTKEIWERALVHIKASINSDVAYNVYIEPITAVSCTDSVFVVRTALSISKSMINLRYRGFIESALKKVTGQDYTLDITIEGENYEEPISAPEPVRKKPSTLNQKYTFENFVVGGSNKYAYASAKSATEKPGYIYNPLFFYGNSGLGKTHLMHAIGNKILETYPDYNIIYVTSEQFMNEFVDSLLTNSTINFKRKYRDADVLLIDDIQFLEDKEGLQEEVFHTFNDLYSRNKQIVITSDRMPNDLVKLEERLRTRFGQGLTFDISIPDFETRLAILKKKANEHNVNIPNDALSLIADKIKTNIRELEGALIKIISMAEISNSLIDINLAKEVVDSILPNGGIVKINSDKIIEKTAVYYNVSREDIIGNSRSKQFVVPRQVAMYLCHTLTNMKFKEISNAFGGKDRTSAMHNVKKIKEDMKTDENLAKDIDCILKDIHSV